MVRVFLMGSVSPLRTSAFNALIINNSSPRHRARLYYNSRQPWAAWSSGHNCTSFSLLLQFSKHARLVVMIFPNESDQTFTVFAMRVVGLVEPTPRSAEILGRRDEKPNKSRKHQKLTTVYTTTTNKFNAWDVNRKMAKLGGGKCQGKERKRNSNERKWFDLNGFVFCPCHYKREPIFVLRSFP